MNWMVAASVYVGWVLVATVCLLFLIWTVMRQERRIRKLEHKNKIVINVPKGLTTSEAIAATDGYEERRNAAILRTIRGFKGDIP